MNPLRVAVNWHLLLPLELFERLSHRTLLSWEGIIACVERTPSTLQLNHVGTIRFDIIEQAIALVDRFVCHRYLCEWFLLVVIEGSFSRLVQWWPRHNGYF